MKDLKEILKFLRELPKMMGMLNMPTEKVDIVQSIREIVYEWKGYKDLAAQGKLLKLPCAVGDTVYSFLSHDSHFTIAQINKIEVKRTIYGKMCYFIEPISERGHLYRFFENDFGKTVFLTREEAEAALKER